MSKKTGVTEGAGGTFQEEGTASAKARQSLKQWKK